MPFRPLVAQDRTAGSGWGRAFHGPGQVIARVYVDRGNDPYRYAPMWQVGLYDHVPQARTRPEATSQVRNRPQHRFGQVHGVPRPIPETGAQDGFFARTSGIAYSPNMPCRKARLVAKQDHGPGHLRRIQGRRLPRRPNADVLRGRRAPPRIERPCLPETAASRDRPAGRPRPPGRGRRPVPWTRLARSRCHPGRRSTASHHRPCGSIDRRRGRFPRFPVRPVRVRSPLGFGEADGQHFRENRDGDLLGTHSPDVETDRSSNPRHARSRDTRRLQSLPTSRLGALASE